MPANVSNVVFYSRVSARTTVELRIEVMSIIFVASLLAASFPTLSKRISILRIPKVIFFIGKHFGTGVILATAFTHLLDDAFRSLQNPLVRIRYGNIGKWTGLIILGSLLVIFLVEYISTSYVDYLQSKPSAPPTPIAFVKPSPSLKPLSRSTSREDIPLPQQTISTNVGLAIATGSALPTETSPLLPSTRPITDTSFSFPRELRQEGFASARTKSLQSRDHSPHRCHHHHIHRIYSSIPPATVTGGPIDVLTNSPRIFRQLGMSHLHSHSHVRHTNEGEYSDEHHDEHKHLRVRRRRQVVGLLVLQLGIMIHSLVIGLTLAVTDGSDFTSLTTAILFHQLFEGLSLGIRIATLPPSDIEGRTAVEDGESLLSTSFQPTYIPSSITPNADSDLGDPSNSTVPPRHSHTVDNSSSQAMDSHLRTLRDRGVHWLKPTLSILFAVTTPFGMGVGMILWKDGSDSTQMLLIKGTMSAISAGMLIYAATVEMMAGDFVFGDVDGGHGHGHGHLPLPDPHQSGISRLENQDDHQPDEGKEAQEQLATATKKALAVLSLFAGVAGMVIIG